MMGPYQKPLVLAVIVRLLALSYFSLVHPLLHSPSSVWDTSSSAQLSTTEKASGQIVSRLDPSMQADGLYFTEVTWQGHKHEQETASGQIITRLDPFLRWDGLYFAQIALRGYKYEQETAFLPGWLLVMRWSGTCIAKLRTVISTSKDTWMDLQMTDIILGGALLSNVISIVNVVAFQMLTRLVTKNERFAQLCAILYAIHPAPAISSVAYTEPFYALCTFTGSILLLSSWQPSAAISHVPVTTRIHARGGRNIRLRADWIWSRVVGVSAFMLASGTRSLGLLNCFVVVWPTLLQVYRVGLRGKMITITMLIQSIVESLLVISTFAAFQYDVYRCFCVSPNGAFVARPWCEQRLPLVYNFVQAHYWDVGFLRYWTPAQIPNFLMASPILVASVYGGYRFASTQYRLASPSPIRRSDSRIRPGNNSKSSLGDIDLTLWKNPDAIPFFLIHIITTYVLIFASHTQIALRLSLGNPVLFWIVGALLVEGDKTRPGRWARYGVVWSCAWGAVSLVLWAGFYPPA